MAINYYRLLGVPPDADSQRLKSAYRSLAKRFHPDVNQGSEAAADLFRQINNAYNVLSDPQQRAAYDASLPPQGQSQPEQPRQRPPAEAAGGEQKFNRFVNSLLDAIFGPLDPAPGNPQDNGRPPAKQPRAHPRKRPDFSFYYHLERNRRAPPYEQGEDGIFRQVRRSHVRAPVSGLLLIVLSNICSLLNP